MTDKLNRCYFQAATGGTDDFVFASAVAGFLSPDDAAATDGDEFQYIAENGSPPTEWEIGTGPYDAGSTTLARTTVTSSSNGGSPVTFSAAPKVRMGVPLAADFVASPLTLDVTAVDGAFTIDTLVGVSAVNLTTDASGECSLDIVEFPPVGQIVRFVLANQVDPGDSVLVTAVARWAGNSFICHLASPGTAVELQKLASGSAWGVFEQGSSLLDDGDVNMLSDIGPFNAGSQRSVVADGSEIGAYVSSVNIVTDDSGTTQTITFDGANDWAGAPFPALIQFTPPNGGVSGDILQIDPANFRTLDGSTPASISFDTQFQSMSLTPYDGSTWMIIGASSGVVTP